MLSIPPPNDGASRQLLDRARNGDQDAWQTLFDDCYPKICRVVRRKLNGPMRKIYDSTDIANDVIKSLYAKFDNFDFSSIDGLRAFLIRAAEQKLIDGYRRGHAAKRDLNRDRPLGSNEPGAWEPADSSPTASQVAVASEQQDLLLDGQSGQDRMILEMKLRGFSNSDVAKETGLHLRKIERFLAKLAKLRGTWRLS